jgi:hypothetical protein
MDVHLPSVDAVLVPGDAAITPCEAGEGCRDIGETGIAVQQDADLDLVANGQHHDADALAARSGCAERLPDLDGVARDQACHRGRRAFGKRSLAHESPHKLASPRLEHELKLGGPGDGGPCHGLHQCRFISDRRGLLDRSAQVGEKVMGFAAFRAHLTGLIGGRRCRHTRRNATTR